MNSRHRGRRRLAGLFAALCLAAVAFPGRLPAQYFGQNKVQYESFDFKVLKTPHFDIYYYPEEREAAEIAGRMAERWYARLSRLFDHQLSGRQPIIMYASHPHFEQTNALPGQLDEGTGGVTEIIKRRMVLPFAGPLKETDHVLGHEMVHAFQFDVTGQGRSVAAGGIPGAARLPLWFIEGMAEYMSLGPEDPNTAMWMRAATKGKLPSAEQLNDPSWFPYRYGQAFLAYLAGRYGDEVIGRLLKAAGRSGNPEPAFEHILGHRLDVISKEWHQSLHQAYDTLFDQTERSDEYGTPIFSHESKNTWNLAPVLSPDGKKIAFLSTRGLFSIDLYIADAATGKVERRLTHTAVDAHFQSLEFINSAGAWSPDGKRFALAGVQNGNAVLSLLDVASGHDERDVPIPAVGEVFNPSWSPDGQKIVFSALVGGLTDLYVYDLGKDRLERLTNDAYADLQPTWSPDGKRIAWVTDRFGTNLTDLSYGNYRIGILDPSTGAMQEVPGFDHGKNINPQWAPDGQSLYFLSDRNGITDLYRVRLADSAITQLTNLYTGISGITDLSPALSVAGTGEGHAVVSVFRQDGYELLQINRPKVLAGTKPNPPFAEDPAALPPRDRVGSTLPAALADAHTGLADTLEFETRPYQAHFGLDYIAQPSVAVGSSQFGTYVGGGAALFWSDMLGDHNLATALQVNGTFKDIAALVSYTNLKHRLNWGVAVQQYPYLTGYIGGSYNQNTGVTTENIVRYRQTERSISGIFSYPFSRVSRLEFSAGVRNISFDYEVQTQAFDLAGNKIFDSTQSLATYPAMNLATTQFAFVHDNSIFGATSPILGSRERFEITPILGSIDYVGVLADVRRYFMPIRPFTFAFRVLHYGRYGPGAEDQRQTPLYLGYPGLVRGYDYNSFNSGDCTGGTGSNPCPLFSQLVGSRMLVGNAELRFPLFGVLHVGAGYYGFLPIEMAIFGDAGWAWWQNRDPSTGLPANASFLGGTRDPVTSAGVGLRMNVFGFAIIELDYAHAFQRHRNVWQFSFIPGY